MVRVSWSIKMLPRWAKFVVGLLLAVALGMSTLLAVKWPFTQNRIVAGIERATGSTVHLGRYRTRFFPEPGCIIEDFSIQRKAQQPIARAQRIDIRSSWLNVLSLRNRIGSIVAQRLEIQIPLPFPPPVRADSSEGLGKIVIGDLVANGATLDFITGEGSRRFLIDELRLGEIGSAKQISYATVLDLPDPPGRLTSSGTVGPIARDNPGRTPVAGTFELRGAELDKYKGLAGSIGGKGKFDGPLENISITGMAMAADFEVNRTGHPITVRADYRANVNGPSGDVILEDVEAAFLGTHLSASGSIQGKDAKTVAVRILSKQARVEDLLEMFTRSGEPALKGPIQLHADAVLLPGDQPFLNRITLRGGCVIRNARWTRPNTQMKVNGLSARARGDKEQVEEREAHRVDHVLSQLKGDVSLKDGVATLSGVSFQVPGAMAAGGGTYNLITRRVDLKGTVSMVADASEATSGFKSILLKPFDALFRRHRDKGATLPVSVTGQYPRPAYRVGLKR